MINQELTKRLNLWAKSNPRLLARQGLCFHIQHILGDPVVYFDHDALEKHYKYYSGDALFPVSSPLVAYSADVLFRHNWENLYINEYGKYRLNPPCKPATAEVHELAGVRRSSQSRLCSLFSPAPSSTVHKICCSTTSTNKVSTGFIKSSKTFRKSYEYQS